MSSLKNKKFIVSIIVVGLVSVIALISVLSYLNNKKTYDVTFYSDTGVVLKIDTVQKHSSATPPGSPQITYGKIFKAWDSDFSDVTSDLNVYPVCEDTKGETNVIAVQSVYSSKEEVVTIPIQICGNVCMAGLDIVISYDEGSLELQSIIEDGSVIYNDSTPGIVKLNYVSSENTTADIDLCNLKFSLGSNAGNFPISVEVKSIYAFEGETDELYVPDFIVVDGMVYVN